MAEQPEGDGTQVARSAGGYARTGDGWNPVGGLHQLGDGGHHQSSSRPASGSTPRMVEEDGQKSPEQVRVAVGQISTLLTPNLHEIAKAIVRV